MHTCFHAELREGISELPTDEATHVVRVLRLREGDEVRLVDGVGGVAVGTLLQVDKRRASVEVGQVDRETERPQGLIMVVAPTKHTDRFEWLLEKATELGVSKIFPIMTNYTDVSFNSASKMLEKMHSFQIFRGKIQLKNMLKFTIGL